MIFSKKTEPKPLINPDGRRKKDVDLEQIIELRSSGASYRQIATILGNLSHTSVKNKLIEWREDSFPNASSVSTGACFRYVRLMKWSEMEENNLKNRSTFTDNYKRNKIHK